MIVHNLVEKREPVKLDDKVFEKGTFFALRIDIDPYARKALQFYANSIRAKDPGFAASIERLLYDTHETFLENMKERWNKGEQKERPDEDHIPRY